MQTSSKARAATTEHDATRGVLSAVVIGAVLWAALVVALRWLLA